MNGPINELNAAMNTAAFLSVFMLSLPMRVNLRNMLGTATGLICVQDAFVVRAYDCG
jgi:hypothetical protein